MPTPTKQKIATLAACSLLAAGSVMGPATGTAHADEGVTEPGVPHKVPPAIPDDPGEGLPKVPAPPDIGT